MIPCSIQRNLIHYIGNLFNDLKLIRYRRVPDIHKVPFGNYFETLVRYSSNEICQYANKGISSAPVSTLYMSFTLRMRIQVELPI
jgi:hypothetical protein